MGSGDEEYLAREARARKEIDRQLGAVGWVVQSREALNLHAGRGVAVREFILDKPHGRVDYLLFVDRQPAGVIEAARNWTLEQLVEEIDLRTPGGHSGVTPSMVSGWELGRHMTSTGYRAMALLFAIATLR